MCSDTVQTTRLRMGTGARSKCDCSHQKGCRTSMSTPGRDTMHLRNKRAVGFFAFLLLATGTFLYSQGKPDRPQPQQNQQPTPTALPADIDPADPALPVWARPAPTAPPAAASADTNARKPAANGPPGLPTP